jgi:hypothetical protein
MRVARKMAFAPVCARMSPAQFVHPYRILDRYIVTNISEEYIEIATNELVKLLMETRVPSIRLVIRNPLLVFDHAFGEFFRF